jgi:predicted 2-oxoglutarate/Fe(II)-dependent dioxygenase YbiX
MLLTRRGFISQSFSDKLIKAFQHVSANHGSSDGHVRKWQYRTAISAVLLREAGIRGLDTRLDRIRQKAAGVVTRFYGISFPAHIDYTLMSEMKVGDCVPPHADNEKRTKRGVWRPNHTPYHHCTAVLYLNTCGVDYEGGLLRFPSTQQQIIPQRGLLVGFLSNREYEHEVTPVRRGCRYSISIWVSLDPKRAESWIPSD